MTVLPRDLAESLVRLRPRLCEIGHDVRWFGEVGSTNDIASALAEKGAPEGTVVVADSQTAGRGRIGRTWWSPPGAGLYVSIVLRPPHAVIPLLTIAAGVAMAEGVEAATGLAVQVKWPNDLYVDRRKLGGLLAESANAMTWVIVGVGINLLRASYPLDLAEKATSVESELGRAPDRGLVLGECLAALATRYRDLREDGAARVVAAWRHRAAMTLGRRIEWDDAGSVRQGRAEDVAADGALLVRVDGALVPVRAGEVRWR
jgi:BirA family transcriptional regulator, biotin operon repressor / biotin---[acetyl-CoA-carboxylase] ligase